MRMLLTVVCLLVALAAQAQLINSPFGFYAYERGDLAQNKVSTIFDYYVSSEEEESYGEGYLPDDSVYSKRMSVHASGWLIEVLENSVSYGDVEPLGVYSYVYAGPGGKVSRIEFEGFDTDSYTIAYTYDAKGTLLTKKVITIDPTEEQFENKKGLIVASKKYVIYPVYNEEGEYVRGQPMYMGKTEYTNDQKGQLIQSKVYSANVGDPTEHVLFRINRKSYTPEGRLLVSEEFEDISGKENLVWRYTYSYGDNNLLRQVFVEDVFNSESYYLRYVYQFQ